MNDVLGSAMHDYYFGKRMGKLWVINKYGPKEEMQPAAYFRQYTDMPEQEQMALKKCRGHVLDIGAGAGSHTLALQQKGVAVTALDISAKAVEVMQRRGIWNALQGDIFSFANQRFDTLLMMMNGIGLCGNISGLKLFLQHAKSLLNPDGQLLFDSTNVAYLYKPGAMPADHYYGEIAYRYQYKKQKTNWFTWLFIHRQMLQSIAAEEGYKTKLLYENNYGQYLVKLTLQ